MTSLKKTTIPFQWNGELILMTIVIVCVVLYTGVVLGGRLPFPPDDLQSFALTAVLLLGIFLVIGWVFAMLPLSLSVDQHAIRIRRPFDTVKIPIADIVSVRLLSRDELRNMTRSAFRNGMKGYLGYHQTPELGKFMMYATQRHNLFLLETRSKKYVVSCTEARRVVPAVLLMLDREQRAGACSEGTDSDYTD